jgi:adenosylcobinamide-GDP ribazoletransferase
MLFLDDFLKDLAACLRFYSRFALSERWGGAGMPDFRALAIAGAVIGAGGAGALLAAQALGLQPLVAATLAIAALVALTGALHEDGLADVADGFGGGATRVRKLEIMRDSRLGSYGAAALGLSLMLRVFALAALTERGLWGAALALIAAGAVSRVAGLLPLLSLAPARADGAGATAQRPGRDSLRLAFVSAAALSLLPAFAGASLHLVATGDFVAVLVSLLMTRLAQRQIGGYTGDVLGAAQQASEIAFLLALSAA